MTDFDNFDWELQPMSEPEHRMSQKIKDYIAIGFLVVVVAASALFVINKSIEGQNDLLTEIRNGNRAIACILSISPEDRTPALAQACLAENGL
jgi:hypothetical protein